MQYVFRPLGPWTEGDTPNRRSRWTFKADWTDTLVRLDYELTQLGASNVVLQADFNESDLRLDGMPRANARQPVHPGVRLAFDSKHGPLTYATDAHEFWQHNVRAIALALESLRAVDRYGVTRRGEQYTGWKALPVGTGDPASHMTADEALAVLREHAPLAKADEPLDRLYRWARAGAHPDRRGGNRDAWDQVEQAANVLGLEKS